MLILICLIDHCLYDAESTDVSCVLYRVEEGVMGEPQLVYVQLTRDVVYFQEHMEVHFSHVGKHRFAEVHFIQDIMLIIFLHNLFFLVQLLSSISQ